MRASSSSKSGAMARNERVEKYIAALPEEARRHVQAIREAIRAAVPSATEAFGYGMPAFAINGKAFVWYAAWKRHSSLYPISQATARALAGDLRNCEVSGKGTIRFRLGEPLPARLVKRLVKARVAELRKASAGSRANRRAVEKKRGVPGPGRARNRT